MRYIATGRVLPERANVHFAPIQWDIHDYGKVIARCDSSQISMTIELADIDGFVSAYLSAEHFALVVVCSLGFALGSGYSVEIVQIIEENGTPHVFGVRPIHGESRDGLGFNPHEPMFIRSFDLANKNIFFRFALRDYLRAIGDPSDCPTHCYRAIEGLKSAFVSKSGIDSWDEMHVALGTTREMITATVKDFADPVRHGNWVKARATSSTQRWQMLSLTRSMLTAYLEHEGPESSPERLAT
jgi:hypothetical protein